jgi:uncharacterized repeat protein (TIGR03803 family)
MFCSLMLASCSHVTGSSTLPAGMPNDSTATLGATKTSRLLTVQPLTRKRFKSLYSFKGSPDAAVPAAALVSVNGTLYGTTIVGGGGTRCTYGCGTVFTVSTSGKEHVLYRFKGTDGANPMGPVIYAKGTLYGTTGSGGTKNEGTVFKVDTSGREHVVYNFKGGMDGSNPRTSLTVVKGAFYGTTEEGGGSGCFESLGCGTVFEIDTSGKESVLFSFDDIDGAFPAAGLIDVNGNLYGTTSEGGAKGYGTVFGISTTGQLQMSYSFGPYYSEDGAFPYAGLIDVNGTLYGTTYAGGATNYGTVFNITTSGTESVLYSFKGEQDGELPEAGLIDVRGALYGTTIDGGGSSQCGESGCGTVFKITTSGTESLLYRFNSINSTDGALPFAPLIDLKGTLYGTTEVGGYTDCGQGSPPFNGCGTIFEILP